MSLNVKVPWEIRLGDIGEAEIKARLCHFSIPTKYTRDVGIDFYCELLENGSPTTPFYVQAKGSEHFDDDWAQSIKKSTIVYWLFQPFPVFLIVHDNNDENCYWMSIEDYRYYFIEKSRETNYDSIYIKMDRSHVLEKGANSGFVRKMKENLASIELFRGRPQFKGEGYVKIVPDPPRSESERVQVKENIRQSMYALVIHYLRHSDLKEAYFYCDFLTKFDRSHYNHFVWFGQINKALGKKNDARRSYEEALEICRRDPNWPAESMKKIIEYIEQEIKSCE